MNILKVVLIFIAAVAIFYVGAMFLGFVPKPAFLDQGIAGNAELKVTLLMDNNVKNPLPNIEVDVAVKPGQPPKGGVAMTDQSGTATFKIKPGTYSIFFNENSFPKNLKVPELVQITVSEGVTNEKTVLVTTSE